MKDFVPPISIWESMFHDLDYVEVVSDIPKECDALVVSPGRCDVFGCPAGTTEETSGVMYVYDQKELPEKYQHHPRFLISNAVWKTDPKLIQAVQKRIQALVKALTEYNTRASLLIQQPAIKTETLGFWREYSDDIQQKAMYTLKRELMKVHEARRT